MHRHSIAAHLAARLLVNSRLDQIATERLDAVHAAWCAEAPAPEMSERDRRHAADRRAIARWQDAGRRAGDHARQRAELDAWEVHAA